MKKIKVEYLDVILQNKNIQRLDPYVNSHHKSNWKCTICSNIWITSASSIINSNSGCPKCSGKAKLNSIEVNKRLKNRNVVILDKYISGITPAKFQCIKCNFIWKIKPQNILNSNSGCPQCSQKLKLTNEILDNRINNRNIISIDKYVNASTKIRFQCNICQCIWAARPGDILNSYSGCIHCNRCTKNEKLIYAKLYESGINFLFQKYIKEIDTSETLNFRIDFYFPDISLVIEYNGDQHYRPVRFGGISNEIATNNFIKQQKRDNYIRNFCKAHEIRLIEIDGRIYKNKKLDQFISNMIIGEFNV